MMFSCIENLIEDEFMAKSKTDFKHFDALEIRKYEETYKRRKAD